MKCLLFLSVLVHVCSGSPLHEEKEQSVGESSMLNIIEPDKETQTEKAPTADSELQNVLVTQGFFTIKQADGRWFTEVYSADSVRGTRILYCELGIFHHKCDTQAYLFSSHGN